MSHTLVAKFAPVADLARHNSERWNRAGRRLYEAGSLRFAPGRTSVPLLVDHRDDLEIGTVTELFTMDWVDGAWFCARAEVNTPPGWLRPGTKVSFAEAAYQRRDPTAFGPAERVARALVGEVSILPPGVEPAEPCAEVLMYRPTEPGVARSVAAGGASYRHAATEDRVFYSDRNAIIRRPCGGKILGIR